MIDSIRGNASETDVAALGRELEAVLVEGEAIERAFKRFRDAIVFTDRRLILIDKQGVTGRKVAYHSVPYRAVTHFTVETAGSFDGDAELSIWVSGRSAPIRREFARGSNIIGVQRTLAERVTR